MAYVKVSKPPSTGRCTVFRQDADEHPRFDEVLNIGRCMENLLCGITGVRVNNATLAVKIVGEPVSMCCGCNRGDGKSKNCNHEHCADKKLILMTISLIGYRKISWLSPVADVQVLRLIVSGRILSCEISGEPGTHGVLEM